MKIIQLLPELNEGGVERGVVELNRELVKLGHESIVVSAGGKQVQQIVQDGGEHITMDVCSKNPLTAPWRIYRLRQLLARLSPDIVHARSRVPAWLAYLANRRLGFPFITTVHGFNSVSPYSAVMTKGERVICVSSAIKQYIQEHYDVSDEKIAVIPRGIDLETFNPQNLDAAFIDSFSKEYGLNGKFVVTTVGRITQLKDHPTFIRAIAQLKKSYPDIAGLVVGGIREDKEVYFESLKALSKELGVEEHIRFVGSQKQVAEIYALSDVVVSSSSKPESFGRSVAEAIAVNTPVVATGHGGVLDIVTEGENGALYAIGDAEALAEKIEEVRTLDFDGHTYIKENFSLENMVERTVKVYEEVRK